jgi:hypothetical protein
MDEELDEALTARAGEQIADLGLATILSIRFYKVEVKCFREKDKLCKSEGTTDLQLQQI